MATTFFLATVLVIVFIVSLSIGLLRGRGAMKTCAGPGHDGGCACRASGDHDDVTNCEHSPHRLMR